jgi:hypothetical protein
VLLPPLRISEERSSMQFDRWCRGFIYISDFEYFCIFFNENSNVNNIKNLLITFYE